jgi:hypothetical protein
MRPGDRKLRPPVGESAEKAEVLDEPERAIGMRLRTTLSWKSVRSLRAAVDLDAG